MRKTFAAVLLSATVAFSVVSPAQALDIAGYKAASQEIIREALSGKIADVDATIEKLDKLVALGVQGCLDYAAQDMKHAALMKLVAGSADAMKAMTLDEIEEAWHEGGELAKHGINFDAIEHFGPAISHMDSVVHPATAIIALKEYKKSGDAELLAQVKDELSEVLEHLSHIE